MGFKQGLWIDLAETDQNGQEPKVAYRSTTVYGGGSVSGPGGIKQGFWPSLSKTHGLTKAAGTPNSVRQVCL